jgi:DNA-binding NtrC family response regulator
MSTVAPTTTASILTQSAITSRLKFENSGPVALIATSDSRMQQILGEALEDCGVSVEFAAGFGGVRDVFAQTPGRNVAACLCGFALADGSYREVVKFSKRQTPEVPVIIVSTPAGSNEYDEYLSSMNAGAFDFLCYPYDRREVQRILRLAVSASRGVAPLQF